MMDSYFEFQRSIEEKYGSQSVILMMVGSFYEIYEYNHIGKAQHLSSILNLSLTKKDKKKELSLSNPFMCGFPSFCLQKYVDLLVRHHDFTVGIVDQHGEPDEPSSLSSSNKKLKQRSLSKIYSPSIPYEYDFAQDDSVSPQHQQHVCMIFHVQKQKRNHLSKHERLFLSYVIMNLSFGHPYFHEEEFQTDLELYERLDQLITKESVREQIYLTSNYPLDTQKLSNIKTHPIHNIDSKYSNLSYQQKVCHKVFPQFPECSVIQDINLERHPIIVQLLTYLFDFIYDHCPLVLTKIQPPILTNSRSHVHYNIRSFYELNILNTKSMDRRIDKPETSLLDTLDFTSTPMGSRHLRHIFFVPTYDTTTLQHRYDRVSFYMNNPDILSHYRNTFQHLCDIEKKCRLMHLNKASPHDLHQVIESIQSLLDKRIVPIDLEKDLQPFLQDCQHHWKMDEIKLSKHVHKIDEDIHRFPSNEIIEWSNKLKAHDDTLNSFVNKTNGCCSLKYSTTSYDVQVITTKRKWTTIANRPDHRNIRLIETKSSGCYLSSDILDHACRQYALAKEQLCTEQTLLFLNQVQNIVGRHTNTLIKLCRFIEFEDVMLTFAYCSLKYRYTKPILDTQSSTSFIHIQNLRHPIIERINHTEPFTSNDISLHTSCDAILVYGLNSAGKSTLLKSIGIAVLLAQIGMFVPATHFHFHPFHTFFTKIFVLDNIYKGQSTFLYELAELKHILNLCDAHSLILCDELTSGTETYSATGLLASTILHCLDKKSKIAFTTHLHTLSSIPEITDNPRISIQHFSVHVQHGNIVYDRKLQPGMGDSLYGIEIADAIGFPSTFIKKAFDVRNKIAGNRTELVTNRRSRYNKKVIVDSCTKCGSIKDLHTHHIVPQHLSDEQGFIGTFHKNRAFNLEVLCAKCHQEEHSGH